MRKLAVLAVLLVPVAVFASGAIAPPPDDLAQTRTALRAALAESRAAEARSAWLERAASSARDAAERTAREAAALAARIQQAEAAIAVAEIRLAVATRERSCRHRSRAATTARGCRPA